MDEIQSKVQIKRPTFTKLGNCYGIFMSNRLFILIGPHWPFMLCVIPLILSVLIGYIYLIASHMKFHWQLGGVCIILSALLSYTITALKDPGVVMSDTCTDLEEDTSGSTTLCKHCLIFKDKNIEHCDDCGLCMKNLDHHCIFTGKCIADKNLTSFYIMLISIFGFFIYSMIWIFLAQPIKIN